MKKFYDLFTPERRQMIQLFFASLAPLAILGGFATEAQTQQILIGIGAALQFLASILSLVNVRKGDWSTGWTIVRGAIYGLVAVISPILVFFGLYDESTNASILTGVSLALSTLSSLLAVFIGKTQQLEEFKNPTYNGTLIVNTTDPMKDTHKLEIDQPWDELGKLKEVRIQVVDESDPLHVNGKD